VVIRGEIKGGENNVLLREYFCCKLKNIIWGENSSSYILFGVVTNITKLLFTNDKCWVYICFKF
jgi:hypothetical protein